MSAFLAHKPFDGTGEPGLVIWYQDDAPEPRATVVILSEWKRRYPRLRLLPVEVSAQQWTMFKAKLAAQSPAPAERGSA